MQYVVWHAEKDPEKLWKEIVKTHNVECAASMNEVMDLEARMAHHSFR